MSYLLDTNVICELVKAKPAPEVIHWFDSVDNLSLYLSVITLGEIKKGIAGIVDAVRREKINHWLEEDLPSYFGSRILCIDGLVAKTWGTLLSDKKARPLPAIDSLIGATAIAHNLKIVTRNVKDFTSISNNIVNPWS